MTDIARILVSFDFDLRLVITILHFNMCLDTGVPLRILATAVN